MRWFRVFIWIGMIAIGGYMISSSIDFADDHTMDDSRTSIHLLVPFEPGFVHLNFGYTQHPPMLEVMFTLFYVLVLINTSNNEMNSQRRLFLNNLLRFNILLSVFAGASDVADNYFDGFAMGKYYLVGWMLLIIVLSLAVRGASYLFYSRVGTKAATVGIDALEEVERR